MNLEATRHHDKPFAWGVQKAAEMGYEYIEPMVHWGRELMSEAGYYHTVSMMNDPLEMKELAEKYNLKISGLQGARTSRPAGSARRLPQGGHPVARPRSVPRSSIRTKVPRPPGPLRKKTSC